MVWTCVTVVYEIKNKINSRVYIAILIYKMNVKQVQQAKKSVCRVLGSHRGFNYGEPYLVQEECLFGGTAFFVDPTIFGAHFPIDTDNKRFLITNFHVVEELVSSECTLSYPHTGNSMITATVVYAVPNLDVAILMVDPYATHPMWTDNGDVRDFIDAIPNLQLETNKTIKGDSQNVMCIGYPNLSTDVQLAQGCISGRGLGMIQCTISLNGGNSGGPLMMKGKCIGICTASITDSEALGLAVPILQVVHFFTKWTRYEQVILKTPSWGIETKPTTLDYLQYHGIDTAIQGSIVTKTVDNYGVSLSKIKPKDIIMGIRSGDKAYNVDRSGLISVPWADKRIPISNQEFILSLTPEDICFTVFKWSTKKIRNNLKVTATSIPFEIRTKYHAWEPISYTIIGGIVFQDLCMNHLTVEDEDDEAWCPPSQVIQLSTFISETLHMEKTVVCTYIPPNDQVNSNKALKSFDRIIKVNNKKVKSAVHLQNLVEKAVNNYDTDNQKSKFIVLETPSDKIYYSVDRLMIREVQDSKRSYYPVDKLNLLNIPQQRKKRRRAY